VSAAAELFASRGYSATSVDEIGASAGVSGPALYRHFANKQAVLDRICLDSFAALLQETFRIVASGAPADQTLRDLVRMRVDFAYGPHRHAFMIIQAGDVRLSEAADAQLSPIRELYKAEWMRVLFKVSDAPTNELQVAWFAAHVLIGHAARSEGYRDEAAHRDHIARMALATLLS
jgi:AcrR family transcriptional regulator